MTPIMMDISKDYVLLKFVVGSFQSDLTRLNWDHLITHFIVQDGPKTKKMSYGIFNVRFHTYAWREKIIAHMCTFRSSNMTNLIYYRLWFTHDSLKRIHCQID